jgi:hypothetical protein
MASSTLHPNDLCPYIISYYYRVGISTNDPDFDAEKSLDKFIAYSVKSGLLALHDDDQSKQELTAIGDFDPATRLLFIQHHAGSLTHPITTMSKPIVKLGGGRHYEFVTAGGTYDPHHTHRAVVRMRSNREGLLHYKWSWTDETEDGMTYVSGVVYCDLVKLTDKEYDACIESNMSEFDLLAVLQDKRIKYKEMDRSAQREKKEANKEDIKKRKRGSMFDTVSSLFSVERKGREIAE